MITDTSSYGTSSYDVDDDVRESWYETEDEVCNCCSCIFPKNGDSIVVIELSFSGDVKSLVLRAWYPELVLLSLDVIVLFEPSDLDLSSPCRNSCWVAFVFTPMTK